MVKCRLDRCQLIGPTAVALTVASHAMGRRLYCHHDMIPPWDAWDTVRSMDLVWPVHLVCIAIAARGHLVVPSKVSARFRRHLFSPL